MNHNWEYKKIGDVAKVIGGSTPITSEPKYWNGDYLWITPADLNDAKYYGSTQRTITLEGINSAGLSPLPVGTVLLSSRAPIGKLGITTAEMYCNQGFKNIVCGDKLINEFVYYYLGHIKDLLQEMGSGTTFKEISKKTTENVLIPVPPLAVQEQIVAELDALNATLDKCRQLLATLDSLAQSLFHDTFGDPISNPKGWEVHPLKNAVIEMFLGPFGSALKTDCYIPEEDSYAMVYEQKHAIKKTLNQDNHFISEDKFNSLKRFEVLPGDFLMSCRGTIGQLFQVPANSPRGIIHPSLMKIRLKTDIYSPKYFNFLLPLIMANESTKGNCVQMAITAKELGAKILPVPPLDLQEEFARKIEAIEAEKNRVGATMAEVQTLLASRMDFWFN